MDEVCLKVTGILDHYLEEAEWDRIGYDADLAEQGLDSMKFIQVIVDIEAQFDIEIPDEYLFTEEMGTVNKIADVVRGLLDENMGG